MKDFITIFDQEYSPILGKRADTFRAMFQYLESLNKDSYTIVETGTTRYPDNFIGDGCSTILFDRFINTKGNGVVYTVDINPDACKIARSFTSPNTIVTISDSVIFLDKFQKPEEIDLLYLDSFDFDFDNPHPSAFHHIKELAAIYPKLKSGCLIAVDDNFEGGAGKGMYTTEFLKNVNAKLFRDDYQICFIKP